MFVLLIDQILAFEHLERPRAKHGVDGAAQNQRQVGEHSTIGEDGPQTA